MNKLVEIILWTLAFFAIYFPASYFVDWYLGSEMNFAEMFFVGMLFALLQIVILFLLIPEKVVENKESVVEVVDDFPEESRLPQESTDVFRESEVEPNSFGENVKEELLDVEPNDFGVSSQDELLEVNQNDEQTENVS